jgi:hypothetical protein
MKLYKNTADRMFMAQKDAQSFKFIAENRPVVLTVPGRSWPVKIQDESYLE